MSPAARPWSFSLRTLFFVFVGLGIGSCTGARIYRFHERLASEYTTARVIREVTAFVSTHQGQWPASWADIPNGSDVRPYVHMKFEVDTAELVADPELIHTVITPTSGTYHTYPHARTDLEALREVLAEQQRFAKRQAAAKRWAAP